MNSQTHLFPKYCFDANCIISLWNDDNGWYNAEVFPSLKSDLEKMGKDGNLVLPREVITELSKKDDGAQDWAKKVFDIEEYSDESVVIAYQIMNTPEQQKKVVKIKRKTEQADVFIIAVAESAGMTVVSNDGGVRDVCDARGVKNLNFLQFMKEAGFRY